MIQYSLKCENDHSFDSWFASADAYDKLADNGMMSCTVCGSTKVSKAIMAPRVRTTKGKKGANRPNIAHRKIRSGTGHGGNVRAQEQIQNTSGRISPQRPFEIWDARTRHLWRGKTRRGQIPIEDGIPVTPPFMPTRKSN